MSSEIQPTYKFRWSNVDLKRFEENCMHRAKMLQRDADILLKRAEQIEEEAATWTSALEPNDE